MALGTVNRQACAAAIDELLRRCEDIDAAILARRDGRPFVDRTRSRIDPGRFAAMSSSLLALGSSVLRELDAGALDHVLVDGSHGKLVLSSVPGSASVLVLAVLANHGARLGMVLGHAKACAQAIGSRISVSAAVTPKPVAG